MKVTFPDNRIVVEAVIPKERAFLLSAVSAFYSSLKVKEPGVRAINGNGKPHKKHRFKKACPICGKMVKTIGNHSRWKHPEEWAKSKQN